MPIKNIFKCLFVSFIFLLFTACSIKNEQNLKYDLRISDNNRSIIKGKIFENTKSSKPIHLVLFKYISGDLEDSKNYKLIDYSAHHKAGDFLFTVTKGIYFIYACQDLEILRDEKFAYEFSAKGVLVEGDNINFDITLNEKPSITTDNNILISSNKEKSVVKNFRLYENISLSNNIFERENATMGLISPFKFYKEVGGGLYSLGNLKESKQVILFVHGINGTPRDFSFIIDSLDKKKYIPLVYFYPTGMNLNYSVDGLKYSLTELQDKYNFKDLIIVAHSMGGLVSRGFINIYNEKIKIKKFITMSTPWNGQKFAALGSDYARKLVPSFGNMAPKSAYIENNIRVKYPSYLKHYLLFSYKGRNSIILDSSNDGVISLSSQLYNKVQKNASQVYGLNENHASILKSKITLGLISDILNDNR